MPEERGLIESIKRKKNCSCSEEAFVLYSKQCSKHGGKNDEAKYGENPMTAEQLALAALQAQAQIGANMLDNLDTDAQASGAANVQPAPSGIEENETSVEDAAKGIAEIYNNMKGAK